MSHKIEKVVLANSFSINMLKEDTAAEFVKIAAAEATERLQGGFVSAIGHADTAAIVGGLLGIEVPANRVSVTIDEHTLLVVAQYSGPRLPEGATELPVDASIQFWAVTVR